MRNKLMRTSLLTPTLLALLLVTAGSVFGQDMISNVTVAVDYPDYTGPCPKDIHLRGKFQVNEARLGVASVQFMHSNGFSGHRDPLINDKRVYDLEVALRQTNSWSDVVFLRVTVSLPAGPKHFDSSRIAIKGQCRFAEVVPATVSPLVTPATGRFRVTLTGFLVNQQTLEGPFSIDGRGDEVFALVNSAELGPSNNILGPFESRMSVRYGDTEGRGSNTIPGTLRAGRASETTGGLLSGDPYPPRSGVIETLPHASPAIRARLIPMVLWQGELRRGGPNPNAAVIIPTIWENDNTPDVLNEWNRQVESYFRILAAMSNAAVTNRVRPPLIQQRDVVLSTPPNVIDFDHPLGIQGDTFNPLAPAPLATFIPAVMFLTYDSAEAAATGTSNSISRGRGVIEITYRDGHNYGDGSYTIFLLVERLP